MITLTKRNKANVMEKPRNPLDINPDEWCVSSRTTVFKGDLLVNRINNVADFDQRAFVMTDNYVANRTPKLPDCPVHILLKSGLVRCMDRLDDIAQLRGDPLLSHYVIIERR